MGTAPLAATSLCELTRHPQFNLAGVVTQPDRPKGRDLRPQPSAVKTLARELNLPVLQPERARNEAFIQQLRELTPDLIVVAAYGQILPPAILNLPKHGCLNVHASLLPRWRGAAPIQWAILAGDPETGVTLMKMDAGLDTGEMLATERTGIAPEDNAQTLHDRLAQIGAGLLVRTIPDYVAGNLALNQQPVAGVTYARKITKEDGRIDWQQPARDIWNRLRAFTPWPGLYSTLPEEAGSKLVKIWEVELAEVGGPMPGQIISADKTGILVACGSQSLRVKVLQREGGRRLGAQDFLAGHPLKSGVNFE